MATWTRRSKPARLCGAPHNRAGFDRLAGLVSERLGRSARTGALFVFFGRRREAIKVLFFDGSGLCLFYKRLDQGTFRMPEPREPGGHSVPLLEPDLIHCGVALVEQAVGQHFLVIVLAEATHPLINRCARGRGGWLADWSNDRSCMASG